MRNKRGRSALVDLYQYWRPATAFVLLVFVSLLSWAILTKRPIVVDGLVAFGTLALAVGTVGLIVDAREARYAERRERDAAYFRAALIEQVENCRHWYSHNPKRGEPAVVPLRGWQPSFEAVVHLLGAVTIPGKLVAYLVWLIAEIQTRHQLGQANVAVGSQHDLDAFRGNWDLELFRLQTLYCLIHAETVRREFKGIADAFDPGAKWLPWLKPQVRPTEFVDTSTAVDEAQFNAPEWPNENAYKMCCPEERNRIALNLLEQAKVKMMSNIKIS